MQPENMAHDLMVHAILEQQFGMIKADLWLFEKINKMAAQSAEGKNNGHNIDKLEGRNRQNDS
jgi:hypothetical protein